MREKKYTQCVPCIGTTLQESVQIFNTEMKRLAGMTTSYERVGDSFLIYVKLTELAPETLVEAKQMQGCDHVCKDCHYCERDRNRFGEVDARKKYGYCIQGTTRRKIRIDQTVCDTFYLEHQDKGKEVVNG